MVNKKSKKIIKKLTTQVEVDNRINFLDTTVSRVDHKISFKVYRKPTATDIINPNQSCPLLAPKASSN